MESQVIYVTHSLFMINKSFPTRHRLLMKNEDGTTLDGKPYVGRWQAVLSTLGLTLTGSILFANHVVLTEGDSDPIYLYAMIQKAIKAGKVSLDINSLAIMSTSESKNTDVLLRILCESNPPPKIVLICDGDKGGRERLDFVKSFIESHRIPVKLLTADTSIEDHLPMIAEVYVLQWRTILASYLKMTGKNKPDLAELSSKLQRAFDEAFGKGKVTKGIAEWTNGVSKVHSELSGKPSKVGIAREYAALLMELPDEDFKLDQRSQGTD